MCITSRILNLVSTRTFEARLERGACSVFSWPREADTARPYGRLHTVTAVPQPLKIKAAALFPVRADIALAYENCPF